MLVWLFAMLQGVFFYREAPAIPYCATADRMEQAAARELLLLAAACVIAPLAAAWLLRQWQHGILLALGCVAVSVASWLTLGLLGVVTGDRLAEAVRGVVDPPQPTVSQQAVPDLCRQVYPDWDDVVRSRQ
jgi:hypothetical protein